MRRIEPVPGSDPIRRMVFTKIESVPDSYFETKFRFFVFYQPGTGWFLVEKNFIVGITTRYGLDK